MKYIFLVVLFALSTLSHAGQFKFTEVEDVTKYSPQIATCGTLLDKYIELVSPVKIKARGVKVFDIGDGVGTRVDFVTGNPHATGCTLNRDGVVVISHYLGRPAEDINFRIVVAK